MLDVAADGSGVKVHEDVAVDGLDYILAGNDYIDVADVIIDVAGEEETKMRMSKFMLRMRMMGMIAL